MQYKRNFEKDSFAAYAQLDEEQTQLDDDTATVLDEVFDSHLFELERGAGLQARSRAGLSRPQTWKCYHEQRSGWIPIDDPQLVCKAMVPKKTRVDNASFRPPAADDVNFGTIGQDERQPWTNTLNRPYRWVCKLGIALQSRNGTGTLSYAEGSGVLIGNRYVLTAAHNLLEPVLNSKSEHIDTREARAVVVIPGLNGIHNEPEKVMPFGWSWGSHFMVTADARRQSCLYGSFPLGQDFAVVKLVDDLGNRSYPVLGGTRFGHWGHELLGSNTLMKFKLANSIRGVSVNIMGYPGDRCRDRPLGRAITQRELDNCSGSEWASVPWLSFERILDPGRDGVKFGEMQVQHDFAPGMSGGPVWIRWKGFRNMLGISSGVKRQGNFVVRFTETALKEISSWIK